MTRDCPILWLVIPCYNEQEVLPITAPLFLEKLDGMIRTGRISGGSRILFVDDGSSDRTWPIIRGLAGEDPRCLGVSLSRNRGHQHALLAGLMEASSHADITISIDCDGQDDLDTLERMVDEYAKGYEIVYGVRSDRSTDSWYKRSTAHAFYKLMRMMGCEILYDHADLRLASSKVLTHLAEFQEVNLFLRGMFPLIGFPSTTVPYRRARRMAGESHYPLRKMLALAFDGITSLSMGPIRLITGTGIAAALLGLLGLLWSAVAALATGAGPGLASICWTICFFSGLQLLALGVLGEYLGKTYMETKRRPRYIIEERTWEGPDPGDGAP